MPELFPDDAALLSQAEDADTGVPYIPTGASPYVVAFRRLVQRTLLAAGRANDLRVYAAGGRMVGVRGGRCFVGDQPREVSAQEPIELSADALSHVYVDATGAVVASTGGLPADRALFIPLAAVSTDTDSVTEVSDLRSESIYQAQTAALAGITASSAEINAALDGIAAGVTAANISILTEGAFSSANALHQHTDTAQQVDGEASVSVTNLSAHGDANIALDFSLPSVLPDATHLRVNRATGFLEQRHMGQTLNLLGAATVAFVLPGELLASAPAALAGIVPVDGEVVAVVFSCGQNTQSSISADGISTIARVNGSPLTTTHPELTSSDGAGFVSTDQGAGTTAAIVTNGVQIVRRGDQISIELVRAVAGTLSQVPTGLSVLVVIRASRSI